MLGWGLSLCSSTKDAAFNAFYVGHLSDQAEAKALSPFSQCLNESMFLCNCSKYNHMLKKGISCFSTSSILTAKLKRSFTQENVWDIWDISLLQYSLSCGTPKTSMLIKATAWRLCSSQNTGHGQWVNPDLLCSVDTMSSLGMGVLRPLEDNNFFISDIMVLQFV